MKTFKTIGAVVLVIGAMVGFFFVCEYALRAEDVRMDAQQQAWHDQGYPVHAPR